MDMVTAVTVTVRMSKRFKNFQFCFVLSPLICIFAAASACLATMSSEDDGADGWSTTY